MQVGVVGCGYLGAVHAVSMAKLGHHVVGVDVDAAKIDGLRAATPAFFEPGLPDLLKAMLPTGRLSFDTDLSRLDGCQAIFVCVGTPQRRGELAADTRFVEGALDGVISVVHSPALIVGKSTVPVGTAGRLCEMLRQRAPHLRLAWNPEFLREGHAIQDTLTPDRLVFGAIDPNDLAILQEVYAEAIAQGTPVVTTGYETAELVKTAANAFLATKISFINAMAEVCEAAGADVTQLAEALGHDPRIGRAFLGAGLGFGGGCLPKDIRAFMARAGELGADQALSFLREVDAINMRRRSRMVELARHACHGSLIGQRIAVLGAAFKPNSDDIRDSPALNVAAQLRLQGADVVVTDPQALANARQLWPDLTYVATAREAVQGADVVMLLTEWPEYLELDPAEVATLVRSHTVLDGRNALDRERWVAAGWTYRALGRSEQSPATSLNSWRTDDTITLGGIGVVSHGL
ncbi:MAG: UDP-glucose dehydrogenase family protein [Actinomycetales bacterium]